MDGKNDLSICPMPLSLFGSATGVQVPGHVMTYKGEVRFTQAIV